MAPQEPEKDVQQPSKEGNHKSNGETKEEHNGDDKTDKNEKRSSERSGNTDNAQENENSDTSSCPPVKEVRIDDRSTSTSDESHGRLPIPSIKFVVYALAAWCGILVVMIKLERAGMTENLTDMRLEEFLKRTGWASNHNVSSYTSPQSHRVGYRLAQEGATVKYPVVMIPGFVTSGLELWDGKPCAKNKYFRQRMWGGIGTARQFFTERDCWREHLALDPLTGVDPEGIRLRSCQGFEAADYFAANYWVWSKLIENLADLGYDGSTMSMMSYDWRLAYPLVEKRDGYLTHLRHHIEAMHKTNGEKVVLAAHSMGSPLIVYFFKWITTDEADGGGGGGQDWVDEHIHAFVNIAGPMLGVPKATPALLSGEMRDTSLFVGVFGSMIEEFFGRRLRKDLWNTWGSLWAMLPKGGDQIWGIGADLCNSTSSCDGLWCKSTESQSTSMVPFLQLTDTETLDTREEKFYCEGDMKEQRQAKYLSHQIDEFSRRTNHSIEDTLLFLEKWGGGYGASLGNLQHNSLDQDERPSPRTWSDPSRTPLPHAPKLKIYCLYGVGLPTERAYFYQRNTVNAKQATADEQPKRCNNSHFDPPFIMNSSVSDAESNISYGVKFSDGDGSVPLLSMGYICVDAWKRKELNPSGSKVITREYYHSQEFHLGDPMRGGPHAADHVDILGNVDMTEDFLRVVSDHGAKKMKSNIVSDIMNITERINAHPNGGLYVEKAKQNPFETFLGLFNKK